MTSSRVIPDYSAYARPTPDTRVQRLSNDQFDVISPNHGHELGNAGLPSGPANYGVPTSTFSESDSAAVAAVTFRGKWLLILSNAQDDRYLKWCFPGGMIERMESPADAAKRECFEETGVRCEIFGKPFKIDDRPVSFVYSVAYDDELSPDPREMFTAKWFTRPEIESMDQNGVDPDQIGLYANVFPIIQAAPPMPPEYIGAHGWEGYEPPDEWLARMDSGYLEATDPMKAMNRVLHDWAENQLRWEVDNNRCLELMRIMEAAK